MSGWIKIHRSILDWEWYEDTNTFRLFIHLILKANHKDKNYKGKLIKRGCLVTGRDLLSVETGLSVRQIRTSLTRLKMTNEVTIKSNSKGTEIQIVNYDKYQLVTNEETNERPTKDQQVTTNKNVKKEKNNNIDERKLKFADTIKPFVDVYGKDICTNFYNYWTEPNPSNTRLRFEMEKTWDIKRRLNRWNNNNFKKHNQVGSDNVYVPQQDLN